MPVPLDAFTVNLCPNPNFNYGITGWSALPGTSISLSPVCFTGTQSLLVETGGLVTGEGIVSPSGISRFVASGSVQLRMLGDSGSLLVSVFASPSSISPLASVPVTLNDQNTWQPVVIDNIGLLEGQQVFISVTTASPQQLSFWVDAVQFQDVSPSHLYIDGDQQFCTWTGTPGNSVSYQEFQFPMASSGTMILQGKTVVPVVRGASFAMAALAEGILQLSSSPSYVVSTVSNPVGAFDDFSFYQLTDPDPAQAYVSWNNAGTRSGQTGYQSVYGMFYAPSQYQVSTGQLWPRAQYFSVGAQLASLGASQVAEAAQLQAEPLVYQQGTTPVPSAYDQPRAVHTVVKPARLNYCPNPSAAVSSTGWYLLNTASVLARSNAASSSSVSGALDAYSVTCKINSTSGKDGLGISIANLIVGDVYTVSAWTMVPVAGFLDVIMSCSGATASSFQQGAGFGQGGFGSGPYGGINTATDMTANTWYNPVVTFTAQYSTLQLLFTPTVDTGTFVTASSFYIDAVLLEPGEVAGSYFDGSFLPSTDYMWEQGGTAGQARSYYYPRYTAASGAITTVLPEYTPLGISYAAPQIAVPPTQ